MNGSSGVFPAGTLLACNSTAYPDANNASVTVETNQQVEVEFPGGTPPFRLWRVDYGESDVNCPSDRLNGDSISFGDIEPPFTWTVDAPYHITGVTLNGSDAGVPFNRSYMNPGDSTIFVITQMSDLNKTDWADNGLPYWTSSRYVIGDNPLPANSATSQMNLHLGLLVAMLLLPCLTAMRRVWV